MPAANVTVTAYFVKPTYQAAWAAAKAIIEAAVFELPQAAAGTQSDIRYLLADMIKELLRDAQGGILFTISPTDVVVFDYNFLPAQAGTADNPGGTDGYFEFRVTPPETRSSAYNDGAINATSYDDVANEQLTMNNEQLRVWTQNGVLQVSGLTSGKSWSVYNLYGQLIYTGIAEGNEAKISLQERGVYIVQSGGKVIKTIY